LAACPIRSLHVHLRERARQVHPQDHQRATAPAAATQSPGGQDRLTANGRPRVPRRQAEPASRRGGQQQRRAGVVVPCAQVADVPAAHLPSSGPREAAARAVVPVQLVLLLLLGAGGGDPAGVRGRGVRRRLLPAVPAAAAVVQRVVGAAGVAEPDVVGDGARAERRHHADRDGPEPEQEDGVPVRRPDPAGGHGRQRRAAGERHGARVRARGRQHHRADRHRLRQRGGRGPQRRQLRHQAVRRRVVLRGGGRGHQRRRPGGRAQDEEDRHPGALRGHQADGTASASAGAQEGQGEEQHRRARACSGAVRRRRDAGEDGHGEHGGALVQG
jgi:hypothetical protein